MYVRRNKRQLQAQETKQHIFDVAQTLFREKGFNNVTVEEIADTAGMSVGSLYHHFKNKYEILTEWHKSLDACYETYFNKIKKSDDFKNKNRIELIREMEQYFNETSGKYGPDYIAVAYSYMLSNSSEFGKLMASPKRMYFRILVELIEEGQKRGEIIRSATAVELAHDITIASRGCLVDWVIEGAKDDIRSHYAHALNLFLKGIATKPTETGTNL